MCTLPLAPVTAGDKLPVSKQASSRGICKISLFPDLENGSTTLEIHVWRKTTRFLDVTGVVLQGDKYAFSTSPVYGQPAVHLLDCAIGSVTKLVSAKNKMLGYKDGADFFQVIRMVGGRVTYLYAPDIEAKSFEKTIETLTVQVDWNRLNCWTDHLNTPRVQAGVRSFIIPFDVYVIFNIFEKYDNKRPDPYAPPYAPY